MQNKFSPQLIARAQRIFKKKSGRFVSADEVEICLDRLARVGLIALKAYQSRQQKREEVKSDG